MKTFQMDYISPLYYSSTSSRTTSDSNTKDEKSSVSEEVKVLGSSTFQEYVDSNPSSSESTPTSSRSNSQAPFLKVRRQASPSPSRLVAKIRQLLGNSEAIEEERSSRWSSNRSSITIVPTEEAIELGTVKKPVYKLKDIARIAVVFCLIFIVGFTNESATGANLPALEAYYHKTSDTIAVVFVLNIAGYICSCIFSSAITKYLSLQWSLLLAGFMQICGTLIFTFAPKFPIFLLGMALLGLGSGLFDAAITTFISHYDDSPVLMDWLYACFAIGAIFPPIIIGNLIDQGYRWSTFYYIPLALTAFFTLLSYPIFIGYTSPSDEIALALPMNLSDAIVSEEGIISRMKRALKLKVVWLGFILIFVSFATSDTLSAWLVSYTLSRSGEGLITQSRYLLSSFWSGISFGRIILPFVGKRLGERTFSIGLLTLAAGFLTLFWTVHQIYVNAISLVIVGFFLGPVSPRILSMLNSRVSHSLKGVAMSFAIGSGLIGASLGPLLFGIIGNAGGLHTLPAVLIGGVVVTGVGWCFVPTLVKEVEEKVLEVRIEDEKIEF